MSCSQSCDLFYKKKDVCVSDPCASVGLNCRSYGADNTVYDCLAWCCERDTSTLAIFVIVIIIVVLCCGFCCAFAIYRFRMRKEAQGDVNGIAEDDQDLEPAYVNPPPARHHHHHHQQQRIPNSGRSSQSTFTTSSYGGDHRHKKRKDPSTSSQGRTSSQDRPELRHGYRDDYSESASTARSGANDAAGQYDDDNPDTGFLDEPTVSARSGQTSQSAGHDRGEQRKGLGDSYFEEGYSARSNESYQAPAKSKRGKGGVWEGDVDSYYYNESTQASASRPSRQLGETRSLERSDENLFAFEDDF